MSGQGGDEIISDYKLTNEGKTIGLSCFGGLWPANLSAPGFFPWCNFYYGSQRSFLTKEELVGGAHGIEARYPFLDPKVVQEYLYLTHTVKNSLTKRPIVDLMKEVQFPFNEKGKISGFSPARSTWTNVKTTVSSKLCWLTQSYTKSDCW